MYGIYDGISLVIAQFAAPMSMRSNRPIFSSDTLSLKRDISERPAQRWELETNLVPLSYTAEDIIVDLITKGYSVATQIIVPQIYSNMLRRTASSSVTASGSIASSSVTITNPGGTIPKGTFVKFAGHSKIYLTTADISGAGSLGIFPELTASVSSETMTYLDNVIMDCYYDESTVTGMSYIDGILQDPGTVTLVEKL